MSSVEDLLNRCRSAGQEHVLAHWDTLRPDQQASLLAQLNDLDFDLLATLQGLVREVAPIPRAHSFVPPAVFPLRRDEAQQVEAAAAAVEGARLQAEGKVGFVLVAGGQGSRLGYDGPKGCFEVGPLSGRTLFGWHAARLLAGRARYGGGGPWYIMTSATNDAATRAFFEEQSFFGMQAEDVFFFTQRMLPALDLEGRILLSGPDSLFLAPNGHGGTLDALASSGALDHAAACGVELFSYFQVDSPVARPTDPMFLGLHARAEAQMSSKVVRKRSADEKVGVLGLADGVLGCIEYSDLPSDLRTATDSDGDLLFHAGNIANHVINVDFVKQLTANGLDLPWHLARKTMQVFDIDGCVRACDGVKFETFIFDALGLSQNSVTLEVDRRTEFSPVKNAEGSDSPQSSRADLADTFAEWVLAAGGELPSPGPAGSSIVEVDPRVAESQEEFLDRWPLQAEDLGGGHLYS
ncbi:MAG TPA: UDPGP type 1 family protein [Planctomycetes bacterium]|nr:UDPGP type 1 family protein [Planctomycetota bacterium]HIK61086.1 UDPGP type 1 family protein [Planctomycetota bacterium]